MANIYFDKLKTVIKGRVFVYIDAANLERSVKDMWVSPKDIPDEFKDKTSDQLSYHVHYEKFKHLFSDICDLKEIKFYSPDFVTESHRDFLWFLRKVLKFKLVTKPLKEYSDHTPEMPHRKANFDVELAVDATFNLNKFDTFILFSGDCDFEYLLKFLRGQGKMVIVFSRTGHIAKELPPASNYYFDIVDFRHEIFRMDIKLR